MTTNPPNVPLTVLEFYTDQQLSEITDIELLQEVLAELKTRLSRGIFPTWQRKREWSRQADEVANRIRELEEEGDV